MHKNALNHNLQTVKRLFKPKHCDKPHFFLLSDQQRSNDYKYIIENAPQNICVILRTYGNNDCLMEAIKLAKSKKLKTIASVSPLQAQKLKLDGIHIPNRFLNSLKISKWRPNIICTSAHNSREIIKAQKKNVDFILLSSVFITKSNSINKIIGPIKLAIMARRFNQSKIIGLGGINSRNVKRLNDCKIKGIAGVSYV